jgi:hypothetical protein
MNRNEVSINLINLFIVGKEDGSFMKIYGSSVALTISCDTPVANGVQITQKGPFLGENRKFGRICLISDLLFKGKVQST